MSARPHFAVVDQAVNTMMQVQEYINVGMLTTIDVTQDFVENDKENNEAQIKSLKNIMLDYIGMERDLKQFLEAVDHTKKQAVKDGDVAGLEHRVEERLRDLVKKNSDADLRQHEKFINLEEKIWECQHPDDNLLPQQTPMSSCDDDGDEDIQVTQQAVATKCPYTGQDMVHPVTNRHCGHNYDRDGINEYIKRRGKRAKCPVTGCANTVPIEAADLEDNKELKRYIEKMNRQSGKRQKRVLIS
ncbi:E3 SUMO-protein ligase NSE2-like [Gigantopelta aegis]|uniref:E3 SUMO-protein ligase NSE2-like n=1 Tax=Gigantopelta aegis TaxID=1735272 RepID=UPI001B88D4EA|nr:E3 SUMO-protein ligase NSE2-like [Gigantopelta aegis]XP_041361326.1 E3 SUMO-protein ligase NSE2-like [Gigantopelta aegis]XP_041361327.1 E3 SUMO-protein ligase NSE2-like [Gigantopelta aegis]